MIGRDRPIIKYTTNKGLIAHVKQKRIGALTLVNLNGRMLPQLVLIKITVQRCPRRKALILVFHL